MTISIGTLTGFLVFLFLLLVLATWLEHREDERAAKRMADLKAFDEAVRARPARQGLWEHSVSPPCTHCPKCGRNFINAEPWQKFACNQPQADCPAAAKPQ